MNEGLNLALRVRVEARVKIRIQGYSKGKLLGTRFRLELGALDKLDRDMKINESVIKLCSA